MPLSSDDVVRLLAERASLSAVLQKFRSSSLKTLINSLLPAPMMCSLISKYIGIKSNSISSGSSMKSMYLKCVLSLVHSTNRYNLMNRSKATMNVPVCWHTANLCGLNRWFAALLLKTVCCRDKFCLMNLYTNNHAPDSKQSYLRDIGISMTSRQLVLADGVTRPAIRARIVTLHDIGSVIFLADSSSLALFFGQFV